MKKEGVAAVNTSTYEDKYEPDKYLHILVDLLVHA